ncbi:MAG: prepilin-type N-terminal cleavage/methylation domain-containing protein [Gemmatimonadales bacterium]|nr:MAG: prepilin-type N-terminal cleavage/methylation domain-containing protein [Gemmatimonadales bacterium]
MEKNGMKRLHNERGFTLIELMTVVIVLSLLAGISLLKFYDLRNTARAAEVTGDFRSVLIGSYNYYSDYQDWPADGAAGIVPAPLAPYLPASANFSKGYYTLDFDNFGLGGGAYMVGVTVSSTDPDLMKKLIRNLGSKSPFFSAGGTLTYIIVGSDGKS